MLSINTNLSCLITQRSMKSATNLLNQAVERMSTGYKVNHAKDNAAAYSIITNMDTKINAYQVAEDNAVMGLDMVATLSSSLELINEHANRIRELSEQASNGTYGEESYSAIQSEIDSRLKEITRIKSTIEYNGINLINTSNANDCAETSAPLLTPVKRLSQDEAITEGYTPVTNKDEFFDALHNNESICLMGDIDLSAETMSYIGNGKVSFGSSYGFYGITVDGNGYSIVLPDTLDESTYSTHYFSSLSNSTVKNLIFKIDNSNATSSLDLFEYVVGTVELDNCAVIAKTICAGFKGLASVDYVTTNLTVKDSYLDVDYSGPDAVLKPFTNSARANLIIDNSYYDSSIFGTGEGGVTKDELQNIISNINSETLLGFNLQIGINQSTNSTISFNPKQVLPMLSVKCSNANDASQSLENIDKFLTSIMNIQTELGSIQNRLESAIDEISIQRDNLVSSRSTIRDADIAEVSSEYIQQQILQQASATLMATANQAPSIALQLI